MLHPMQLRCGVDQERLKNALEALDAVNGLLRSAYLSRLTCRQLENLKRTLDLEISAMMSVMDEDNGDGDGAAAD